MGKFTSILSYSIIVVFIGGLLTVFALSLPGSGWRALSVQTGSMKPVINPGALVLVHRVPDHSLAVGDVITYSSLKNARTTITHRIVQIKPIGNGKNYYIVKGDANPVADAPVQESQIVGKVVKHVAHAGRAIDFVHTPLGLIIAIYIPAILIAVYEIRLLVRRLIELERNGGTSPSTFTSADAFDEMTTHRPASPVYGTRSVRQKSSSTYRILPLLIVIGMALVSVAGYQTLAQLTSPKVVLTGTTITTKRRTPPGIIEAGTHTTNVSNSNHSSTISNSTNVTVTNNNPQSAQSGNASSVNGSASSGNTSNTSNTAANVTVPGTDTVTTNMQSTTIAPPPATSPVSH